MLPFQVELNEIISQGRRVLIRIGTIDIENFLTVNRKRGW